MSAFTKDDAEALGVRFSRTDPPVLAEYRRDGSVVAFDGDSVAAVCRKIEGWYRQRLAAGVAEPSPTEVTT